jgi:hypothetical protein
VPGHHERARRLHRVAANPANDKKEQACQMVSFQTKNPNLGKFLSALCRLENVDIFYGQLNYFTDFWDITYMTI